MLRRNRRNNKHWTKISEQKSAHENICQPVVNLIAIVEPVFCYAMLFFDAFIMSHIETHNVPGYAMLAWALPSIQRHAALRGNNEPIHIKGHNESPVSPTLARNNRTLPPLLPRDRGGLMGPAWHQKFKWAGIMLFQIWHRLMHKYESCFVSGVLDLHTANVKQNWEERGNKKVMCNSCSGAKLILK